MSVEKGRLGVVDRERLFGYLKVPWEGRRMDMDTPLYSTEERYTFVMNRIRERRAFAANARLAAPGLADEKARASYLQQAIEADLAADVQENTLRILFPERF